MPSATSVDGALHADLAELYRDLHRHPELSFQETRTARIVAERLRRTGFETTTEVGRTGVVGVLRNGDGPTALLRADMDALPVPEATGLPYASAARGRNRDGQEVPVMHACGHDMHMTCLLGAASVLAGDRASWSGTVLLVFQPAEEIWAGARAMVDDGLFDRFGRPDIVLGQHVAPMPAGTLGLHAGPALAAADSVRITLFGRGGHAAVPQATVDPVVMAASAVLRLQTLVSREVAGTDFAIVTVGALHAGTKENIIPDHADLLVSVRSADPAVRRRLHEGIDRIVRAEASASGAPRDPEVVLFDHSPVLVNDEQATARTRAAFAELIAPRPVLDPGLVGVTEDFGLYATEAGVPGVFWWLGGADPAAFEEASGPEEVLRLMTRLPTNHSPLFAPVIEPTLATGVAALVCAARTWLPPGGAQEAR
ncbi:M20 family metallopeptidase [Pseudonocardia yuanmonensis]|uniref:M20 family metallopeptidase n=1 Tax=Pseudonocardia yuanmonensis TaxID=1095914 RepID=A0ABP8WB54_9PSEU